MSTDDTLTLKAGGVSLSGWRNIRVTRSIERLPSDFDLSLTDWYPQEGQQLAPPGSRCTISVGDDLVITGYVDRWQNSLSSQTHEIRVTGRGMCQDLVDCSAWWENNMIKRSDALAIIRKLASVYGISVTTDVSAFTTTPDFVINWGESPQQIIDRICRYEGLLYYDLPDGSLFLTRVGSATAASGVEQGVNIQRAEYTTSMNERFSEYIGLSISVNTLSELSPSSGYDTVMLATASDPEAASMRTRKHITIVESTLMTTGCAQQAINWEMNRRYGRSMAVTVTVDSWRDSAGALWQPNTFVPVNIPAIGVDSLNWILSEVTFRRSYESGTTADLVLMPPEAFTVQPYRFYSGVAGKDVGGVGQW
ncbi:phage baseplate assembly protein [Escherichia coli]|uniref:phage baseplate assembly protein n=1 Tax=Escherichia coli TaxID=562 RepID=UPI001F113912|nr:contractile injection system protein, VgrG/Pvc8 family [Escherichia coli]UMR99561.1 hypothetical protein AOY87_15745 [Escherichia coli]